MISKEKIKNYQTVLSKNEDKIILGIGFILVAVLSFGAGKLSEVSRPDSPIIFQEAPKCESASGNNTENKSETTATVNQGKIIGNKNSLIYHIPGGGSYNKVSETNRVYFNSEEEAQKAGYRKAKN